MDAQCTYAPHAFPLSATRVFLSARNVLNKHARIYAVSSHRAIDRRWGQYFQSLLVLGNIFTHAENKNRKTIVV